MLETRVLTQVDLEAIEQSCTYCLTSFALMDFVVQCPEDSCGRWYHVTCWNANGNHCGFWGCLGNGIPDESTIINSNQRESESGDLDDLLNSITIVAQVDSNTTPVTNHQETTLQDWNGDNPDIIKHIDITDWEINLANAAEKLHFLPLFDRTGLPKVLGKYERTEYYWGILGCLIFFIVTIFFLALLGAWMLLQ